eukprot:gb/GEZN01002530.1/.p1 GENE.gb/GEZN01002530.1/~~gb/GEZN01002530.1/.p1  ORF type:complete len:669 (-),score=116.29 gb/GEZN01002530.1/:444-2324(-)
MGLLGLGGLVLGPLGNTTTRSAFSFSEPGSWTKTESQGKDKRFVPKAGVESVLVHPEPYVGTSAPAAAPSGGSKPHVAVIGAGWAGWAAAKSLLELGASVTLLDAADDPTGENPPKTATGKPMEAGIKGFWKDYPNIEALVASLGLKPSEIFTPCTNSSFYSPQGLEATAPVFGNSFKLPSPLGQIVASIRLFERLPFTDRASMAGLLYATLDFDRDAETFAKYDRMTAHELFHRFGLSKRLVDDFLRPTLLVGLFKPPEELSAAVTIELLYFYALAHQDSFDVKWIRRGTIAGSIFAPLAEQLRRQYKQDFTVKANARVSGMDVAKVSGSQSDVRVTRVRWTSKDSGDASTAVDGVVLAVGAKGMASVIKGSPQLAVHSPELSRAASMGSIDCISVRLWLNQIVPTRSPANVFSRFEALRGAGGTFFMLDQLQPDADLLWGGKGKGIGLGSMGRPAHRGSVVACDFYNSGALMALDDQSLVSLLIDQLLPAAVPAFRGVGVFESAVLRAPGAVSWFAPGSAAKRPPLEVSGVPNLVCAGDWVQMGKRETKAKGLCQERAFISGLEAANALSSQGLLRARTASGPPPQVKVLQIRGDEPQVMIGRMVNAGLMRALKTIGKDSWWAV